MSRLSAQSIRKLCVGVERPMIEPFYEEHLSEGRSGGLSHDSYDLILKQTRWVWPGWMRLGSTIERFQIPTNVSMDITNKSTNVRKGLMAINTKAEPGWRGWLTVELVRLKPWPVRVKAGTPIAQATFTWMDEHTENPYPEDGKYQDQEDRPVAARLEW